MTVLQQLLDEYLATRRALGVRLERDGRQLQGFVAFLELHQASHITTARALQWATMPRGIQSCRHAQLLGKVRQFARYASAEDPRHEIPPPGLLPARARRAVPNIYSDLEVDRLIGAARELSGTTGLRPCPCHAAGPAGCHRDAGGRAAAARPGRRRPRPRRADRPQEQVRQVALCSRASIDEPGTGRLCNVTGSPLPQPPQPEILPCRTRDPDPLQHTAPDVCPALPAGRPARPGRFPAPALARSQAPLRGQHAAALVPRRQRRRVPSPRLGHLPRACGRERQYRAFFGERSGRRVFE